ncbi:MAG: hypothetical protein CK517_03195 [Flavobacteriales bacterium]|nr:MAG: hypothetical protein CK517_03195 [Flavobacteriales bacterium]
MKPFYKKLLFFFVGFATYSIISSYFLYENEPIQKILFRSFFSSLLACLILYFFERKKQSSNDNS